MWLDPSHLAVKHALARFDMQLLQRYRKRETYLEVNLGHVNEFRPDLLDMLTLRPVEYLPLFEQVRVVPPLTT